MKRFPEIAPAYTSAGSLWFFFGGGENGLSTILLIVCFFFFAGEETQGQIPADQVPSYDWVDFEDMGTAGITSLGDLIISIDTDSKGNVYALTFGGRIKKYSPEGEFIKGFNLNADIESPVDLAINSRDELFVADYEKRIVYAFDLEGNILPGRSEGTDYFKPLGITFDENDNLFVVEYNDGTGAEETKSSRLKIYYSNGSESAGLLADELLQPYRIAVDSQGTIFISHAGSDGKGEVVVFDEDFSFLETLNNIGSPGSIEIDPFGFIHVLDYSNKLNLSKILSRDAAYLLGAIGEIKDGIRNEDFRIQIYDRYRNHLKFLIDHIDLPLDLAFGVCDKMFVNNAVLKGFSIFSELEFDLEIYERTPTFDSVEAPEIICPEDITVTAEPGDDFAVVEFDDAEATDNCTATVEQTGGDSSGSEFSVGSHTIEFTATDDFGQTATCTFTITVEPSEEPEPLEISCPGDQTEDLQGACTFTVPDYRGMASTNDPAATVTQSPVAGTEIDENTTIRLTATSNGVTDFCEFEVILIGQPELSISCPGDKSENASSEGFFTLPDYADEGIVSGDCSGISVTQIPEAGTVINEDTRITLTVTDVDGTTDSCEFEVQLIQEEPYPLEISCPEDQTEDLQGACTFTIPDYTGMASTNDSAATVTQSPVAGTEIDENTTIRLTATSNGVTDFCEFEVILIGQPELSISCPGDKSENANSEGLFTLPDYTDEGIVSGDCSEISVTQIPEAGTVINEDTTITLTVTDVDGTTESCEFEVQLIQEEPDPLEISCPGDQTEDLQGACTFTVPDYTGMASTNDPAATVTQSPVAGTEIDENTTIRLTATSNGVTDLCEFEVALTGQPELSISCPGDKSENANSEGLFTLPDYTDEGIVSGDCSEISVTQIPEAGTVINEDTMITLTVTDVDGTTESCEFEVQLIREEPERFECLDEFTLQLDANGVATLSPEDLFLGGSDGVDYSIDKEDFTCEDIGTQTVTLSYSGDVSGSCPVSITVEDNIAPVVSCVEEHIITLAPGGSETITAADLDLGSYDTCGDVTFELSQYTFTEDDAGNQAVILTVTDEFGNEATCAVSVQVNVEEPEPGGDTCAEGQIDSTPPVANCVSNFTLYLNEEGYGILSPEVLDRGSADNCGIDRMLLSQTRFTAADLGTKDVTLTVIDGAGNRDTCTTTVTVAPYNPGGGVDCVDAITLPLSEAGDYNLKLYYTGNPENEVIEISKTSFSCADIGTTQTITATYWGEYTGSCEIEVTVIDDLPPVINCVSEFDVRLNAAGRASISGEDLLLSAEDNCQVSKIEVSDSEFTTAHVGTQQEITLTVTDSSGNISSCIVAVNILPSEEEAYVILYPNPSNGYFYIETSVAIDLDKANIFDMRGRFLFTVDFSEEEVPRTVYPLDLRGLSSGVYTVELFSREEQFIRRAIINSE